MPDPFYNVNPAKLNVLRLSAEHAEGVCAKMQRKRGFLYLINKPRFFNLCVHASGVLCA